MGFFSGLVDKVLPIAGAALGTMVMPGVGTALGAGLGNLVSGSMDEGPQQYSAGTPYDWGSMGGSIGSALGSGMQGWSSAQGVQQQNQWNAAMYQRQMEFNAAEGQKSRDFNAEEAARNKAFQSAEANTARQWQEQMSNTQYQRAVGDMKAAGLNPMLAYSQGGAGNMSSPSPSGSAGASSAVSVGGPPRMENAAGAGIATALELKRLDSMLNNQDASTGLMRAQQEKTGAETTLSHASARNVEAQTRNLLESNAEIIERVRNLRQETRNASVRERLLEVETSLTEARRDFVRGDILAQPLQRANIAADTALKHASRHYTDEGTTSRILGHTKEEAESGYFERIGAGHYALQSGLSSASALKGLFLK